MLDVFHIAKPQGCDIQTFYGAAATSQTEFTWNKPRGVSNIYILLIGAGGTGDGTNGGGSGATTVWYGSALNVPDKLEIFVRTGGNFSAIYTNNGSNLLLRANSASSSSGGSATAENQFSASGFYNNVVGQNGTSGVPTASNRLVMCGGSTSPVTGNYGYTTTNTPGYFQLSPIIVGVGAILTQRGGIGCGGGSASGVGGPGFALIASW